MIVLKERLKKYIKRIVPFLMVAAPMNFSAPSKSEAFGFPSLDSIYKVSKIATQVFTTLNLISYAKENKDLVMSNLSKGAVCKFRTDLSPKIFVDNENLSEFLSLSSRIVGEDKAINYMANLVSGYTTGYGSVMGTNNLGMILHGPSGCGKSLATKILTRCLVFDGYNLDGSFNENCDSIYTITSADIDLSSLVPVQQQLLGDKTGGSGLKRQNEFKKYLENNPDGGIIVVEEIDKILGSKNQLVGQSFQELLRTIVERGEVNVEGRTYKFNNYVVICNTNALIRNGRSVIDLNEREVSLGYTPCNFDRSFLNRFHLVEFEPLSAPSLSTIFNNLIESWNASFGVAHGVNAIATVETLTKIGKYLESTNNGGREAEKYFLDHLSVPLSLLCDNSDYEFKSSGKVARDMTLVEIKFDDVTKACTLEKIGSVPGQETSTRSHNHVGINKNKKRKKKNEKLANDSIPDKVDVKRDGRKIDQDILHKPVVKEIN